MEIRMYRFRLYPSHTQRERLFDNFKTCKEIYNNLLEASIGTYKTTGKTMRKFDYNKLLTGKYPDVFSQVKQNVSDRVAKSFQNFFRRVKDPSYREKGFPRFKSRVHSITYPQSGFRFKSQRHLHISKIGNIPIILHRTPKGKVKTLTIKINKAGQWFAIFSCEVEPFVVQHQSAIAVGLDVGLEHFATISTGETISNPRHIVKAEKRLKHLQRIVSRRKRGSRNRWKAVHRLAIQHVKVANQRLDFLHKTSRELVSKHGFIAVEKLSINEMMHNHHLAKHISDVSWGCFIRMLEYKAVTSGSTLVKVNPRNTSKTCSRCGAITDSIPLNQRMFSCGVCGFVLHRDHNASLNILRVGRDSPEFTPADDHVRPLIVGAVVNEPGTI